MNNKYLLPFTFLLLGSLSPLFANTTKGPPPWSKTMPPKEVGTRAKMPTEKVAPKEPTTIKPAAVTAPIASGEPLKIVDDGVSIQEKGVFTDGCYYGENESISDHAPVLYNDVGTWNIAGPISHFKIVVDKNKPASFFFNHKFFTDDQGNLIGRSGEKLGFLGTSEVVLLTKVTKPSDIKTQLQKNKTALLDKINKAATASLDKLVSGDDPDKDIKMLTLNQLQLDAINEINNEKEDKYKNVIDLISIYDRGEASVNDQFIKRMELVATKIKEFFNNNSNLNYMVLQEVPSITSKTIAGENITTLMKEFFQPEDPWANAVKKVLTEATLDQANIIHIDTDRLESLFAEAPERVPEQDNNKLLRNLTAAKKKEMLALQELAKGVEIAGLDAKIAAQEIDTLLKPSGELENLNIMFFNPKEKIATEVGKTKYKKDMDPDVAIVSRLSAPPLTQEIADHDNRFAPYCAATSKICYVAVHMPNPDKDDELMVRCKDLKNLAVTLNQKGYDTINVLGDYNTRGSRIAKVCKDILPVPNGEVVLHTSAGAKGNNCGSNAGHISSENIDIMIKYEFEKETKPVVAPPKAVKTEPQAIPQTTKTEPALKTTPAKPTTPVTTDKPARPKQWSKPQTSSGKPPWPRGPAKK